jgi:hypothetical protein
MYQPKDSLQGRATGGRSSAEARNFLFTTEFGPAMGPIQLPIQWVLEDRSPAIKLTGREADLLTSISHTSSRYGAQA